MLVNEVLFTLVSYLVVCESNVVSSTSKMNISNAPYTVMVLLTNSKLFCSGVIIDPSWVLTAAHCMFDLDGKIIGKPKSALILGGANSLEEARQDITSGQAQIRSVDKIEFSPQYKWAEKFKSDIALLKVAEPFVPSDRVQVAVLNNTDSKLNEPEVVVSHDHHGDEASWPCTVHGYGKEVGSQEHGHIKQIDYVVNKHCHCLESIRSYKSPVDIMRQSNVFLCDGQNGQLKNKKSVCAGDNGAPLVCNGFLRGIASTIFYYKSDNNCQKVDNYGQVKCGTKQFMNVYTDVCYFTSWLHEVVKSYPLLDQTCQVVNQHKGAKKKPFGKNSGFQNDW